MDDIFERVKHFSLYRARITQLRWESSETSLKQGEKVLSLRRG